MTWAEWTVQASLLPLQYPVARRKRCCRQTGAHPSPLSGTRLEKNLGNPTKKQETRGGLVLTPGQGGWHVSFSSAYVCFSSGFLSRRQRAASTLYLRLGSDPPLHLSSAPFLVGCEYGWAGWGLREHSEAHTKIYPSGVLGSR